MVTSQLEKTKVNEESLPCLEIFSYNCSINSLILSQLFLLYVKKINFNRILIKLRFLRNETKEQMIFG